MEHLVESHQGGYYISNSDPEIIEEYCETCGDHDWIILSWEEGMKQETLEEFFSSIKINIDNTKYYLEEGITKEYLTDDLMYDFEVDEIIIESIFEMNAITEEEKDRLLKIVSKSKDDHIKLIESIYSKCENRPNKLIKNKKINK